MWHGLGRAVVIAILASVTAWLAMRGFVPAYGAPDGPIGDGAARRELVVVVPEDALTLDPARFDRHAITESVHQLLYRRLLRSEEHTSELQSRENLVCRLLLEKKKKNNNKESANYVC